MRARVAVILSLAAAPLPAQRSLYWRDVQVDATLAANGTLRVKETQTIVFTGAWNGGERRFDLRSRQRLAFAGMQRLDSTGRAHDMREGTLAVVDGFDFADARTLRWRSRLPSDPPFSATPITYVLEYSYSNVLVPDGDNWVLDHDFGFADRTGVIENFAVRLELEPGWQPTSPFTGTWRATNLPPGEGFVVRVPLRFTGSEGLEVYRGAPLVERGLLAVVALLILGSLGRRLYTRERDTGRLYPLPSASSVDEKWLEEYVFSHLPEVIGAAWDNNTSASEVAAVLARLVSEGRMRSEVKSGGMFDDPVLHLELLIDRDRFQGYERRLVDALFGSTERTTDTDRIRKRYKKSGFDPADRIRKPIRDLVRSLVPGGDPSRPPALPSVLAFLGAVVILALAVWREPEDAAAVSMVVPLTMVCYIIAVVAASRWRNRVHNVGASALFFLTPMAVALWPLLFVVLTGVTLASTLTLAGLALFYVALANSVLNQARSRESLERIAFRRRLATAREFFVDELRRDQPRLKDAWFPYLIAFGLGKHMDKWFEAFGAEHAGTVGHAGYSSGSSGGGTGGSGGGWTGFGGGGGFSGGGASASWAAAAGSMAAGVSAPSSSSGGGSGGGGGGGGGSSGGGGGGGW